MGIGDWELIRTYAQVTENRRRKAVSQSGGRERLHKITGEPVGLAAGYHRERRGHGEIGV
ncbi:MAG: hypothetical protein HWQ35_03790 [Nostoc sp. NMS1]|uniref:hypothetical protein n=1 Tax=unclassified Nostoc TaxID=2593658 RepID=UPI0025FACC72|nr:MULTISPECIES: hypothetical protein [unclassified Nostoc]MBN3905721.1 hypothetical protein [Nostoc sp. NMS1]MBN3994885.1 hypothetical protein [Nostoc sp. NMS2]